MRRKTKEKISTIFIALLFLISMVLVGYNFYSSPNNRVVELKQSYNRTLTQQEEKKALLDYKTIVVFYHPENCCEEISSFLAYLPEYSNGAVIYCNVNSDEKKIDIYSLNGADEVNDIENKTLIMDKICSLLIYKQSIPDCLVR